MLDNCAAHAIGRTVNHCIEVEADVADNCRRCIAQIDPDAAELVDAAARAVLVAQTNDDTLDAVAVTRQDESQPALCMVCQRNRDWETEALYVDDHIHPSVRLMQRPR